MNAPTTLARRAARGIAASLLTIAAGTACHPAVPMPSSPAPVAPGDPASRQALRDTMLAVLAAALADSAFPGAYAVVGNSAGVLAEVAVGRLDWQPSPAPDAQTVWDMASLTKVVALTSALMQLVEANRVELDAPVQRYLPEWTGAGKERVTVRHLLTHASGLPPWRPLYKEAPSAEAALTLALATPLDTVPDARYAYSDLGAITLGVLVERVAQQPLDAYVAAHVFGPLGMADTRYRPPADWLARIAPTEFDPWRQRHLRGEVHDENAFVLGGVAGHAGLFSSGRNLARFARMYLNGGTVDGVRIFDPATIARFTAVQDSALSHRALGWETPSGRNSAGARMSARAFGHTGFTGTSIWMDPEADVFVVLLTNRVNPTRENHRIGMVRIGLADAALAALLVAPVAPSPSSPASRP